MKCGRLHILLAWVHQCKIVRLLAVRCPMKRLSCTTLTCWVRRDRHHHTTISEDRNYVTQLTDHWGQVESRHARWQFLPTLYPGALCPCWSCDPAINCVGEPFVFFFLSLVFILQVKCFGFDVYIFVFNCLDSLIFSVLLAVVDSFLFIFVKTVYCMYTTDV